MLSPRGMALLATVPPELRAGYAEDAPFPHAVLDGLFDEDYLDGVLAEFPDLDKVSDDVVKFKQATSVKLGSLGERHFGPRTLRMMRFMNSEAFLRFLQQLTGIEETLISDPYFEGGGCHQIKRGGFLKIHADFNRHRMLGLDRRVNVLIYLNKDWREEFGGQFEMWNRDMDAAVVKVAPLFNRMVVFNTTDHSYHGHPEPLACPADRSRASIALYYYSNGRPASELSEDHNTLYQVRPGKDRSTARALALRDFIPPILLKLRGR